MIHKVPSRTSKFGILFSTCMSEVGRKIGRAREGRKGEDKERRKRHTGGEGREGAGEEKRIGQSDKQ